MTTTPGAQLSAADKALLWADGMTRTLRERLAAHDAGPAVGTLVRVTNEASGFHGMTGRIAYYDRFMLGVVGVTMTSTGHVLSFNVADLAAVEGRTDAENGILDAQSNDRGAAL